MGEFPAFERLKEIMETIEDCLASKRQIPALILLYTLIDSVSWLMSPKSNEGVRKRFTHWVDNWLLKAKPLPCTSLELYAARCGVLHTLTSDSDLSQDKAVRRILYSWGSQESAHLQELANQVSPSEYVAIQLEDLYDALRLGLIASWQDTVKSPDKMEDAERKLAKHFMYLTPSTIEEAIKSFNKY